MLVPKKYVQLLSFVFFFSSLYVYCRNASNPYRLAAPFSHVVGLSNHGDADVPGPANSTLGFGAVYAVSATDSPRRARLIQAANVTEIDLTIPTLPQWTDDDEARFRDGLKEQDRGAGHGSIMAWFSHLHILNLFLESGLETALILEDDVDWDIRLRTVQVPQIAAATRTLFRSNTEYYGNSSAWDLLWLGHCGDWFQTIDKGIGPGHHFPSNLTALDHKIFRDSTLPDRPDLHPYTKSFLDALEIPEKSRVVHRSRLPLCTFGYAITRSSARWIIEDLASIQHPPDPAYDMAVMHGCRRRGMRCYTVNPEVFHHVMGDSLIAVADAKEEVHLPPVDAEALAQSRSRKETSNIDCGFWSGDFDFEDEQRLGVLREEVGRKGQCLKPDRYQAPT
ncbi:glycosyltransferase family 25 protein [Diplodia corticola]|uniref:Glycosyltransferase family 25 protein n=1 Tax=Diplodia corticola TaxID=236234 RepID=A0A1J9R5X5_9PEZI|nr:glycosyltransferase family 25 protein [Diplodia corticola]OJD35610.1 glycosyltransferase family 25 protein [Diplodia corticola]